MKSKRCLIAVSFELLILLVSNGGIQAKPTKVSSSDMVIPKPSSSLPFHPSQPIPVISSRSFGSSVQVPHYSSGRKVQTTWGEDGTWQASARLPTSSQTGGNSRTRYKIRRDGSLSLLQIPSSSSSPKPQSFGNNNNKMNHNHHLNRHGQGSLGLGRHGSHDFNGDQARAHFLGGNNKQYSPSELRSFSVVISDVDVTGNYDNLPNKMHNNGVVENAYSKAGVASYHLKSNSIHRMNASWKLKPSHFTPTSSELVEFLSYFANGGGESTNPSRSKSVIGPIDGRATRSETGQHVRESEILTDSKGQIVSSMRNNQNKRKILGQEKNKEATEFEDEISQQNLSPIEADPLELVHETNSEDGKQGIEEEPQKLITWSETSRNIPLNIGIASSSTELINTSTTTTPAPEQTSFLISSVNNIAPDILPSSTFHPISENEGKVVPHELISTELEEIEGDNERKNENWQNLLSTMSENQTRNEEKVEKDEIEKIEEIEQGKLEQEENKQEQVDEDFEDEYYDEDEETDQIVPFIEEKTEMTTNQKENSKKGEKEGDHDGADEEFAKENEAHDDIAKIWDSSGNENNSNIAHDNDHHHPQDSSSLSTVNNSEIIAPSTTTDTETTSATVSSLVLEDTTVSVGMAIMTRKKRKRNAKSVEASQLSSSSAYSEGRTKSTNNKDNNGNVGNARGTSATSLYEEQLQQADNELKREERMKIADPSQTASDLKKLMSLILKSSSDGNRNGITNTASFFNGGGGGGEASSPSNNKSGAQVVNIVITPNQDESSSPQSKNNPQKILFLKSPQVKQMLDIALTDPTVSNAAQKIAAALEANPFPNQGPVPANTQGYGHLPSYVVKHNFDGGDEGDYQYPDEQDNQNVPLFYHNKIDNADKLGGNNDPSTPDGFPLSGEGYLNLNHPNLQFHQALHHMVVNGTPPTSINATTKTNIINIFVINFKETESNEQIPSTPTPPTSHQQQSSSSILNQSPFRIKIKPSSPRPSKLPFSFSTTTRPFSHLSSPQSFFLNRPTHQHDPSTLFINKMGLAAVGNNEDDEADELNKGEKFNNYQNNGEFALSNFATASSSPSDKINIFDLLPGDLGSVTAVQYAPGEDEEKPEHLHQLQSNHQQSLSPHVIIDNLDELLKSDIYNNNGRKNHSMNMPSSTIKYGDYFADFLPDRSRDPPGTVLVDNDKNKAPNGMTMSEHDILSILTSRRPPSTPKPEINTEGELPPALAHLQWLFKNQNPPKPQGNNFSKKTGQVENSTSVSISSTTENSSADSSMMEPDETSHSPLASSSPTYVHGGSTQDLVNFLLKLQNVSKTPSSDSPSITNELNDNNGTLPISLEKLLANLAKNESNYDEGHRSNHHGSNFTEYEEDLGVEFTTKKPVFWKIGNKLPGGFPLNNFNGNSEEGLNNRLRKLLTAFGYSALPTLAAGAAATWPYWVPLMATGRRRRRRSSETSENKEFIKEQAHQFLSNLMMMGKSKNSFLNSTNPNEDHFSSDVGPSERQLLSKTKNVEGNNGKKWIKVDVITSAQQSSSSSSPSPSSSPTLLDFVDEMTIQTSHHQQNHQQNHQKNGTTIPSATSTPHYPLSSLNFTKPQQKMQNNGDYDNDYAYLDNPDDNQNSQQQNSDKQQQSDFPILKNFLKNVLYNEFNVNPTQIPALIASSTLPPLPTSAVTANRSPLPHKLIHNNKLTIFGSTIPPIPLSSSSPSSSVFNRILTKNGEYSTSGNNHRPFSSSSRPSSLKPSFSSTLSPPPQFPEVIAGSHKKKVSISTFTTPSPTSVYIHNWGAGNTNDFEVDNTLSTTVAPSSSPWGIMRPEKINPESNKFANLFHTQQHHHNQQSHFQETSKRVHRLKLADSIKAAEKSYTSAATIGRHDMTNIGRMTTDIDRTMGLKNGKQSSMSGPSKSNFPPVRSQRRLHRWTLDKTDELNADAEEQDKNRTEGSVVLENRDEIGISDGTVEVEDDENESLVDSINAMASHLMNSDRIVNRNDENSQQYESSSERDVYLNDKAVTLPGSDDEEREESETEETASEEDSTDQTGNGERKKGSGEEEDTTFEDLDEPAGDETEGKSTPKLKSGHHHSHQHLATTPRGLTTWSAVNSHGHYHGTHSPMYSVKVTAQKIPSVDYTISSMLSFSTERPSTTQEMTVIKEGIPTRTTEASNKITQRVSLMSPSTTTSTTAANLKLNNRRRPIKTHKKVAPSKFVKAPLEKVTAEVTSIEDTHVVLKTRVSTEAPEMKSTGAHTPYYRLTTKKPLWPYQLTTKKLPGRKPPFSKMTPKPKPKKPFGMRPAGTSSSYSVTTPTTTTPPSTTTYYKNPQTSIMNPMNSLTVSLADIPFMDYIRSQIIPRIGLTLISMMASTPLLLTLLGGTIIRRKKRSLSSSASFTSSNGKALFEQSRALRTDPSREDYDFSAIQRELEAAIMKQPSRKKLAYSHTSNQIPNTFDLITEAFQRLAKWWSKSQYSSSSSASSNSSKLRTADKTKLTEDNDNDKPMRDM